MFLCTKHGNLPYPLTRTRNHKTAGPRPFWGKEARSRSWTTTSHGRCSGRRL